MVMRSSLWRAGSEESRFCPRLKEKWTGDAQPVDLVSISSCVFFPRDEQRERERGGSLPVARIWSAAVAWLADRSLLDAGTPLHLTKDRSRLGEAA